MYSTIIVTNLYAKSHVPFLREIGYIVSKYVEEGLYVND